MKTKQGIILPLLLLLLFALFFASGLYSQKKESEQKENKPEAIIIPEKVKAIFEEGMKTRQPRLDIPFSIVWHVYLPAQQNLYNVFLFKVANADLGFHPIEEIPKVPEKEMDEKEKMPSLQPKASSLMLQAKGHIYLQFNRLEGSTPKELVKEVYVPFNLEVESESFDPPKEETYSVSYILPWGHYLLSMAITSLNMEVVGTQYFEFSVPDYLSYTKELGTTPIFFASNIKSVEYPETTVELHKGFFTYSVLQITPKIENVFFVGKNLDIFFFVFGAAPLPEGKYDININYEVLENKAGSQTEKEEEKKVAIRYAATHYEAPLISQPLPLKKTVIIQSKKEGEEMEKTEQRDLEPGYYTLNINIEDKVSKKSVEKSINFEVK
jgi:hypothetical protein